jgi:hypothetical protein
MDNQYENNNVPQNNPDNNMAIAALVCGILGIIGSFIPVVCYFTTVLAILGVVFGVKAKKTALPGQTGMATAGLVLGIIGVAFAAVGVICSICALAAIGTIANSALYF